MLASETLGFKRWLFHATWLLALSKDLALRALACGCSCLKVQFHCR
jgi:hypothetical protein